MTAFRPTPLDPYPKRSEAVEAAGDEQRYPPELGPDAIAILEGRTFMFSDAFGDVPAGSVGGLLHEDTRFIGTWRLTLDGGPLTLLKSRVVDYYSAVFYLTNPDLPGIRARGLSIRRQRFVGDGLHERIEVANVLTKPLRFELRLAVGTDFADLFEVKSAVRDRSAGMDVEHDPSHPTLHFHYENGPFLAETNVHASKAARIDGDDLVWDLELQPREEWEVTLRVTVRVNDRVLEPMHEEFGEQREHAEGSLTTWLDEVPRFRCESPLLQSVLDKSLVDLAALRIVGELKGEDYVMPAAGLPWFMTLFGRDTIITALQAMRIGPELARGALHLLGVLQGTRVDEFRDEEPGKILHEVRDGELTVTGEKPHSPYYGTADATPLWLVLLSEYWRWAGDDGFVRARWPQVLAALWWIDEHGDRDGDGYVEYATRSSQGLGNQCWKDSWDGIQFSDGRVPYLPIATCEIQGYVYDAKVRIAELASTLIGDEELAARLRSEADALRDRFNRDFWSEDRGGFYVVGLDGDKQQIDSMTSNMGHLLWSGIVPGDRARVIAKHLESPAMFSGWGVRTLSTDDAGYNPIGYHTGTVWPHDNSIIVWGLARYGFREQANRFAMALLEAAAFSEFRLPEAFAGYDRAGGPFPVPYPTACSPQAWATGTPFAFLKLMLGLEVRDGEIVADPMVPEQLGEIFVHGMHGHGGHFDVRATGTKGEVAPTH
ncbi:MAG: glycogen debranching N-terminal domain-containing protein [Actinomycetota bacterium]